MKKTNCQGPGLYGKGDNIKISEIPFFLIPFFFLFHQKGGNKPSFVRFKELKKKIKFVLAHHLLDNNLFF